MLNLSVPPVSFPMQFYQTLLNMLRDPANPANPGNLVSQTFVNQMTALAVLNGMTFGANVSLGPVGGSISIPQMLPTVTRTSATGNTGTVTLQASRTGSSYAQSLNHGYDKSESYTTFRRGTMRRLSTRDLLQPGTRRERVAGVGVHWQGLPLDVIVGSLPLSATLPATAGKMHDNIDKSIRVRFGNGMSDGLRTLLPVKGARAPCDRTGSVIMDVWFELKEEILKDDY